MKQQDIRRNKEKKTKKSRKKKPKTQQKPPRFCGGFCWPFLTIKPGIFLILAIFVPTNRGYSHKYIRRFPIKVHRGMGETSQYLDFVIVLSNWVPDNWAYQLPLFSIPDFLRISHGVLAWGECGMAKEAHSLWCKIDAFGCIEHGGLVWERVRWPYALALPSTCRCDSWCALYSHTHVHFSKLRLISVASKIYTQLILNNQNLYLYLYLFYKSNNFTI